MSRPAVRSVPDRQADRSLAVARPMPGPQPPEPAGSLFASSIAGPTQPRRAEARDPCDCLFDNSPPPRRHFCLPAMWKRVGLRGLIRCEARSMAASSPACRSSVATILCVARSSIGDVKGSGAVEIAIHHSRSAGKVAVADRGDRIPPRCEASPVSWLDQNPARGRGNPGSCWNCPSGRRSEELRSFQKGAGMGGSRAGPESKTATQSRR